LHLVGDLFERNIL